MVAKLERSFGSLDNLVNELLPSLLLKLPSRVSSLRFASNEVLVADEHERNKEASTKSQHIETSTRRVMERERGEEERRTTRLTYKAHPTQPALSRESSPY